MTNVHCWEGKREWTLKHFGETSAEYAATFADDVDSTCMLPCDHEGPHEWTPDDKIGVWFRPVEEQENRT